MSGLRGFTRRNLFRMRQFYATYQGDEKVAPLVRQLPWTHNLIILSQSKTPQEREFYLKTAIREKWSKRDLLFFHRELNCLVAFELKVGQFEPEYLGKLSFYLEALDRDVKKAHEHPAIGVLLCASKDQEVVEYALNRTLSPALIAEYQTQLPDKKLLKAKLQEFYLQCEAAVEDDE